MDYLIATHLFRIGLFREPITVHILENDLTGD